MVMVNSSRLAACMALVAVTLAGCAHQLTLTPADGRGAIGRGEAPGSAGNHGVLRVSLESRAYEGEWTLKQDGGSYGFGTAYAGTSVATGTFMGLAAEGNGQAYMTEAGGGSLACRFNFNSMSGTGIGQCRRDDGKIYDLQIH